MAPLSRFIRDLLDHGRVTILHDPVVVDDGEVLTAVIGEAVTLAALAAPAPVPPIDQAAVRWGFATLARAARFLAHRDLEAEEVRATLADHGPTSRDSAVIFSVDIGLRHLPTLAQWTKALAEHDPLLESLHQIGQCWPLSSVGMTLAKNHPLTDPMTAAREENISAVLSHPGLARLYCERIIVTADGTRLDHPQTRALVISALGEYPDLAPVIAHALAKPLPLPVATSP
jgi:hypothetical protein